MNVIKIGGAVLKNREGFFRMTDILNNFTEKPLVMVISAFSDATRKLESAAVLAESGQLDKAELIIRSIVNDHKKYYRDLLKDRDSLESLNLLTESGAKLINDLLRGLSITNELSPRILDRILSFGEFFALHTVNHFLQEQGFEPDCIDASTLIVTDDKHGCARPYLDKTSVKVNQILLPALERSGFVLTQGFVAKNLNNDITTMGIESSNLTAAILANILDAKSITFWTDVEGFRTADPEYVQNSKSIPYMSYTQGYCAAVNGLKLFYPSMIDYAREKNIELIYKSAYAPESDSTVISAEHRNDNSALIVLKENLRNISFYYDTYEHKKQTIQKFSDILKSSPSIFSYSSAPGKLQILCDSNSRILDTELSELDFAELAQSAVISIFNIEVRVFINILALIERKHPDLEVFKTEYDKHNKSGRLVIPQTESRIICEAVHKIII